jgi:hypothetical protein
MRVLVAIPAYDGKVYAETARALLDEQAVAAGQGVVITTRILPRCSLITMARNRLCAQFLDGDDDRLVFVDSDVSWEPGALARLAQHPVDVVGGAYRFKEEGEGYPVGWLDKAELWADPSTGLLEVRSVPGGFLAISRAALERLRAAHPGRAYEHRGHATHAFFAAPVEDGHLWGEDAWFCEEWRRAGGAVWLDPELTLTHHEGAQAWTGCIGSWLRRRATLELAA